MRKIALIALLVVSQNCTAQKDVTIALNKLFYKYTAILPGGNTCMIKDGRLYIQTGGNEVMYVEWRNIKEVVNGFAGKPNSLMGAGIRINSTKLISGRPVKLIDSADFLHKGVYYRSSEFYLENMNEFDFSNRFEIHLAGMRPGDSLLYNGIMEAIKHLSGKPSKSFNIIFDRASQIPDYEQGIVSVTSLGGKWNAMGYNDIDFDFLKKEEQWKKLSSETKASIETMQKMKLAFDSKTKKAILDLGAGLQEYEYDVDDTSEQIILKDKKNQESSMFVKIIPAEKEGVFLIWQIEDNYRISFQLEKK